MSVCACNNICKTCKETKAQLEIIRLKEILCVIKNIGIVTFDNTMILLALKGVGKDFRIPESRLKEILDSL